MTRLDLYLQHLNYWISSCKAFPYLTLGACAKGYSSCFVCVCVCVDEIIFCVCLWRPAIVPTDFAKSLRIKSYSEKYLSGRLCGDRADWRHRLVICMIYYHNNYCTIDDLYQNITC